MLRLQFDQSLVPLHLRKLALGEADVLEDGAPGDADIPAEAALQTGFDVLGTATFVQSELRVSAEVARLEPRRTDQHARPAAYAGAVPFHRWDGSGLDYENAVGPFGDAAVEPVEALAAQRAAAHHRVAVLEPDVGELQQLPMVEPSRTM